MRIQVLSDLHLEFAPFAFADAGADVLVVAGDVDLGPRGLRWLEGLATGKPVVYVLGNHEYYRHSYPGLLDKLRGLAENPDVHLLENESVAIGGVTFHGCTLWTDFALYGDPRIAGAECQSIMNDYRRIRRSPSYARLRTVDTAAIHLRSRAWLGESLRAGPGPHVVVTHHAPSLRSVPAARRDEPVNAAYASDLEGFVAAHGPALWVHGHVHAGADYALGGCRVVCNPRGYPDAGNPTFDPALVIEI